MKGEVTTSLHMESIDDSGCYSLPQPLDYVVFFPTLRARVERQISFSLELSKEDAADSILSREEKDSIHPPFKIINLHVSYKYDCNVYSIVIIRL